MMLLLVIVLVVLVYWLMKEPGLITERRIKTEPSASRAEEKLKERFVNGEIDEATYLRMKELL